MFGVRFRTLKTILHYVVLGAYIGAFMALVALARALPDLPGKLQGTSFDLVDFLLGVGGTILVLAAVVLLGGLVGGLVGRLKLDAEERARAREESLVVRR